MNQEKYPLIRQIWHIKFHLIVRDLFKLIVLAYTWPLELGKAVNGTNPRDKFGF